MARILIIAFLLLTGMASARTEDPYNLDKNSYIDAKTRKKIKPYLLPSNHPAKPILDAIFHSTRATTDDASLHKAGFQIHHIQDRSRVRVISHPLLPNYLLKVHVDAESKQRTVILAGKGL